MVIDVQYNGQFTRFDRGLFESNATRDVQIARGNHFLHVFKNNSSLVDKQVYMSC